MSRRFKPSALVGSIAAMLLGIWTGLALSGPDAERSVPAAVRGDRNPADSAWSAGDRAYHFGFKKSRNGEPASIDQEGFGPLLERYGAVFRGSPEGRNLYLTFDNGYENGYTAKILDVLKEKGVPACFFVTGHYVRTEPELLKRMVREGHLIGNHSWSHPDFSKLSDEKIREELDRVKREVADITGQKDMRYLRPPRGIFSERSLRVSRDLGYTNVFWSIAYKDWDTSAQRGARYAYENVVSQLHPGAIILLHSVSKDNAEALGAIIDEARRQGYTFRSLDHLMSPLPELPM
ncbi:delta-lactam-biosynthetic de-N-acetylase [Thermobacillus sp. ZCTH02-B1]|uniref:delta-lactam-biosynthetic de-N-acetylase n=1 Tax=Thermobacillus sp. ZCTH02-B1 TaxID=1858795 RepID=UPI0025DCE066|nr:delta-lactam-biosynthetic de-N-acetylase [Thermobacillus sp. ZCTH02-B1]